MDIESLKLTLPSSESPGLETFDPRLDEISTLVGEGDFAGAAERVEALFDEDIFDVRLIGYFLYGVFLEQGVAAIEAIFDRLAHTLSENWEALGPPGDRRVKAAQGGLGWLTKQLFRSLERAESTRSEAFDGWSGQVNSEDVERAIERGGELGQAFTSVLGEDGVPLRDSLSKVLEWLRAFKSQVPDPVSEEEEPEEEEPEEEPEEDSFAAEETEPVPRPATGSPQLSLLLRKLDAFKRLAAKGELYRAAIIATDINSIVEAFDPRAYFPEMFVDFLRISVERAGALADLERLSGSPQWRAAERFYQVDLDAFVKTPLPVPLEWSGPEDSDSGSFEEGEEDSGYADDDEDDGF